MSESKKASDALKARMLAAEVKVKEDYQAKLKKLKKAVAAPGVPLKHLLSPTDGKFLPKGVAKAPAAEAPKSDKGVG